MKQSETIIKIAPLLLAIQKKIEPVTKGATNPYFHSKYADLNSVMTVCKTPCNENGITILQPVVGMTVETILLHTSGEWISSDTPIVCKEDNNPQALGSAISYARRYGLQSMLFVSAEDDDAQTATGETQDIPERDIKDEKKCTCNAPAGKQHGKQCPLYTT